MGSPHMPGSPSKPKDLSSTSNNKAASLSELGSRIEEHIKMKNMSKEEANNFRYMQMTHFGHQARVKSESAKMKAEQIHANMSQGRFHKNSSVNTFLSKVPNTKHNKHKLALDEKMQHDREIDEILNDARILHQRGEMNWDTGNSIAQYISPSYPHKHRDSDSE
ncbi:uncharacterized protein FA14DRAFT_153537 [Meira miltonrushii]|uniref:Uncharacterized protein n=1 Tax=Meira miltonrushii TaxID=1280837 RepID=A0A316VL75_9BASI|nr:uncharacterized protein FA14DRAFT_153537 [Meira miltonrushii]PWN38210.1 hypothetical protein FA14DRAFT_153537 [Meira miltonrushii]